MAYTIEELKQIVQLMVDNKINCIKIADLELHKPRYDMPAAQEILQGTMQQDPRELTPKDLDNLMGGIGYGV